MWELHAGLLSADMSEGLLVCPRDRRRGRVGMGNSVPLVNIAPLPLGLFVCSGNSKNVLTRQQLVVCSLEWSVGDVHDV